MKNVTVQTHQSPKASEPRAREDMSAMLLQKRHSLRHLRWKKCGLFSFHTEVRLNTCGTDTLPRNPKLLIGTVQKLYLVEKQILQVQPITALSLTPTVIQALLLPTRMNATLKVFIAFSPLLNQVSPGWDGALACDEPSNPSHPSNQPYGNGLTSTQPRIYRIINPNRRWWMRMRDCLLGWTHYQHHTYTQKESWLPSCSDAYT